MKASNNIMRRAEIVKSFVASEATRMRQDASAGSGGVIAWRLNGALIRRSRRLARRGRLFQNERTMQ